MVLKLVFWNEYSEIMQYDKRLRNIRAVRNHCSVVSDAVISIAAQVSSSKNFILVKPEMRSAVINFDFAVFVAEDIMSMIRTWAMKLLV